MYVATCPSCQLPRLLSRRPEDPGRRCYSCGNTKDRTGFVCQWPGGCDSVEQPKGDFCGRHYMATWHRINRPPTGRPRFGRAS